MPRIRSIKPEMPSDEALARLSRDARLTFVYLITQSDDDGLQFGTPRQLLGTLFPHNDDVTEAMLMSWCRELESIGAIRWRKTRHNAPVLELTNWARHQNIKNRKHPVIAPMLLPLEGAPSSSGHPPEDLRTSSSTNQPTNQPRTLDHSTKDLGPATNDQGAPTPEDPALCRRWLAMAANKGLFERYGMRAKPILPIATGSHLAHDAFRAANVDQRFAEETIYSYAAALTLDKPPRSLGYFTDHVIDMWRQDQARREAHSYAGKAKTTAQGDQLRSSAIKYAQDGDAEWIEYCETRNIEWRKTA